MESISHVNNLVVVAGFVLALIFGFVGAKTNFCTMGAVSDVVNMGDWNRMRAWLLAITIAMIGTNLLALSGYINLADTIYTRSTLNWLAILVGGLCFGVGMVLGSGCGTKTLIRLGGGNLKSIVVFLFLGYSALVTLKGVFARFRIDVLQAPMFTVDFQTQQTLPALMSANLGMDVRSLQITFVAVLAFLFLLFIFVNADFRKNLDGMLGGVVYGLAITAGWYVTGFLGYVESPETLEMTYAATNSHLAESFTFVGPMAYTLELWAYWTDVYTVFTFAIAGVFGVGIGSFLYSVTSRTFRWENFSSPQDMFQHIAGAILMGFGGVTALGCTIGQGITGISTLALGSFLAFIAIVTGAAVTMKVQYYLMMRQAG